MAPGLYMQNFQFMNGMNGCCNVADWYGGGMNTGYQDGAMVATSIFAIAGLAVKAYQNQHSAPAADPIADKQTEIDTALKEMPEGYQTEATYSSYTEKTTAQNDYEVGKKTYDAQQAIMDENQDFDATLAAKDETGLSETTTPKLSDVKKAKDMKAKYDAAKKARDEVKIEDLKAKSEAEKAQNAKAKAAIEKISGLISERTQLENKKQQNADYDALDKGDGNIFQRNFFNKEFKQSNKAQCRSAIYDFRHALEAFEKDTTNAKNKANLKKAYKNLQTTYGNYQQGLGQKTADTNLTTSMGIADKKAIQYDLNAE